MKREDSLDDYRKLLAHYYQQDDCIQGQSLLEHLFEVSRMSKNTGSLVGLKSFCELVGILYDFGKGSDKFQLYIRDEYRGKVNHSSAGAKIFKYIEDRVKEEYDMESLLRTENVKSDVLNLYSGKFEVCYNMQTAVDGKNKLIINYDIVNDVNDQSQLSNMVNKSRQILKEDEKITVVADTSYFNMSDIIAVVD